MPRPWYLLAAPLLLGVLCAQERIDLPHAIGHLLPPAGWTVLRATDLAAAERASDPPAEPAHTLLLQTLAHARQDQQVDGHVVLHAPGDRPGSLRIVHAYSAPGGSTSAELLTADAADRIRKVLEPMLAAPGTTVSWLGHADAKLFPIGSLVLRFRLARDAVAWELHHHVVPAGERIAYFDAQYFAEDPGAAAAIALLLGTFDGARENGGDRVVRNMLIGGGAGALAGILAALLRRRRLQRAMAANRAVTP